MKLIRDQFDKIKPLFEKGGKFEKYYYIYEAQDTLFFSPNITTKPKGTQIRDANDMKRMMMTVIFAMIPCLLFGIWNAGHQHYLAQGILDAALMDKIGIGLWIVLPIVAVSYASGLAVEFIFSVARQHPVNEGFLVSGMLIALIVPPTIPLWMLAVGNIFAVVIGKEVFGGTGMNILNPALTSRAFLFFAYPAQMSGDKVWTYIGEKANFISGYTSATPLGIAAETTLKAKDGADISILGEFTKVFDGTFYTFENFFIGVMPGSIGETSTLMCLLGALMLIMTGVGSWRIMLSMVLGAISMGLLFNALAETFDNEFLRLEWYYHLVLGGFAFGTVFMATDPVSAAQTNMGKWIYGFLAGVIALIVRVTNPAYPEGVMLAILLMNVMAPLIDHYVVQANKRRRLKRATV